MGYIPEDRLGRIEDKIDRLGTQISELRANSVSWRQVWTISGGLSVLITAAVEILRGWKELFL